MDTLNGASLLFKANYANYWLLPETLKSNNKATIPLVIIIGIYYPLQENFKPLLVPYQEVNIPTASRH